MRTYKKVGSTVHEYEYSGDKLFYEKRGDIRFYYRYDVNGNLSAITRIKADGTKFTLYPICNSRGDVEELRKDDGTLYARYVYDSWGNTLHIYNASGAEITDPVNLSIQNPFRYRGYYYDAESGLYYLQSRYYDPVTCRFVNADSIVDTSNVLGFNMYAYCGNNPVNNVDPTGHAWYHWVIGGAIVAACAAATVITCGMSVTAAATAVGLVANGLAAATTASTVAAGAFIGSATVYGVAAVSAASTSTSVKEFNSKGNWGTVAATAGGALGGGFDGYAMSKAQAPTKATVAKGTQNPKVKAAVQKGQAMHKQMDYGPGVIKEKTIAPGCRVDGIDMNNHIIYELKPNNPQAIARGMNQLERYTAAASQEYGGTWIGVLKLYD